MNRFWIAVAVLLTVNLTNPETVNAAGALKGFTILTGNKPKRKLGIPGALEHSYVVKFNDRNYTFLVSVDTQSYNKARNEKRPRRDDFRHFASMVHEGTEALKVLHSEFQRVTSTWNRESKVNFVLAFVQSITYIDDETTGFDEYYKSAIETLGDETGDCEDSSILFASILNGLSFELALIVFPGSHIAPGHVGVGVKGHFRGTYFLDGNSKYYYCETTSPGWRLGVLPPRYEDSDRKLMPINPDFNPPKRVIPKVNPPSPLPPKRLSPQQTLDKGIKLYEQARFNEAIKSLRSALNRLEDKEKQALAHLYWGCSELGRTNKTEPDYNNYLLKAKVQFSEVFRHDPDSTLPPRIGKHHPVFGPLFEEMRKESIGKLTVTASPDQTGIWIYGNGIKREKIGVGTVRGRRLFKGAYTVLGIYEGVSQKENVKIEPNGHRVLSFDIAPPIVKHRRRSTVSAGEEIPLTFQIISSDKPKQVNIYYGKVGGQRFDSKVHLIERLFNRQTDEVKWLYKVNLPAQNSVGKFEYRIKVEYENFPPIASPESQGDHHRIDIVDEAAPIIRLIKPRNNATFNVNQRFTISAEVTDNTAIRGVWVHFSPSNKRSPLKKADDSDKYTGVFVEEKAGVIRYHLTAIDEAENLGQSEVRHLEIVESLDLVIKEPRHGAIFNINQTITIKAEVTGPSVEAVHLYYGFSTISGVEPAHYYNKSISEDSSGRYTGHIYESKPGYVWYYVTATDEGGKLGKSEKRQLKIVRHREPRDPPPPPPPKPGLAPHQGIWTSVSTDDPTTFDLDSDKMFRLAYLREGKAHSTFGAQLDFSYPDRTAVSAMFQFGPALGKSKFALTLLGGIAEYEDSRKSTHRTPLLGAGLKFYPWNRIAVDFTGSIKVHQPDYDTTPLYHWELGARVYITRLLNLKVGYGKLYLGNRARTTLQMGLGLTF